ncbi:hypothetical protein SVIOM74S_01074 [Streptomyces violarus]
MQQQPGRAQQPVLLGLRDIAGELHTGPGELFQSSALGAVSDDDEPPAGDRPHPLPQPQQQIDPLVLDQPADGDEQRLGGTLGPRRRLLDAVVHDPDTVPLDADRAQRVGRGGGDRDQQTPLLRPGQGPVFESSADPRGRRQRPAEAHLPQVGVDVVDQAQRGPGVPQRRQVRHAVAHLDQQIAVTDLAGEGRPGAQVVPVGAARRHDPVVPEGRGAPAQQGHLVAEPGQAVGELVDQQLGAAGGRVVQISMGEEDDPARMWGKRRKVLRRAGGRGTQLGGHVLGHVCSNSSRGAELSVGAGLALGVLLWGA